MNDKQYLQFVRHFEHMDNRSAYEFQSKFMGDYYLCNMEELTDRVMQDIIDAVLKQKTRILDSNYIKRKKMDKELLSSKELEKCDKKIPRAKKSRKRK